jgi:dipeptidyl aminopeptidase/acylaminoacyl peptidase
MKIIRDIPYAEDSALQELDVYMPEGDTCGVFVYFHGGGLERGDKISAERFADYLTERGVAVVSANYRMYPDAKYPEFLCDAAKAVKWTKKFIDDTYPGAELFVGGSSAGGYISMMLCFDKRYLLGVGLSNSDIARYFNDAGQPTAHYNVLKSRGIDPKRVIVDVTAPLYFIGTVEKYSPMLFIVSDNDMVGRYEQTKLTVKTLCHFGHGESVSLRVMNGKHCEYVYKKNEDGEGVLGVEILAFLDKIFGT